MSESVDLRGRVIKVLAATVDLWELPFATALSATAKAVLDGRLTQQALIAYADTDGPEHLLRTFARTAGLTFADAGPQYGPGSWRIDVGADHIAAAVELLRAIPTGDADIETRTWSIHGDHLARHRVSLHQVRELMRSHSDLVDAARLVLAAFDELHSRTPPRRRRSPGR